VRSFYHVYCNVTTLGPENPGLWSLPEIHLFPTAGDALSLLSGGKTRFSSKLQSPAEDQKAPCL
jgi:hypothetical protein